MPDNAMRRAIETVLFPPVIVRDRRLRAVVDGKTVLVTGASYGIGEAVARALGRAGARVVLVARTAERLDAVCAAITAEGGYATPWPADLTQTAEIDGVIARWGEAIDILVSNAGKSIHRSLFDSLDRNHDFSRTMALNYAAPVRLILGLTPSLRRRGGHIVDVSAANVLVAPVPGWAAYQASKTAFDQWLRCAAPELRAVGIGVSSLYMPLVRTRMIAPNAAYRRMPAMTPGRAARIVCRAVVTRQSRYRPWWLPAGELGSLVLRGPIEWWLTRRCARRPAGARK